MQKASDLSRLLLVDDLLREHGQLHTIAIIAANLTPALGKIIRERGMSAQLHCWEHDDLSVDSMAIAALPKAVWTVEDLTGTRPTTLYPPWNRSGPELERMAGRLGLVVSFEKISLDQYIRFDGKVGEEVINFHHWYEPEHAQLAAALKIATIRERV